MPKNPFTQALSKQENQIGLWINLSSNFAAEIAAHAGFDWALIDMEHSPNDYFSVLGQLQVFEGTGTCPIVRVEWNDAVAVKRLLDLGAPGLLFPMIQSVEEAEAAVASTRYPPHGNRGFSGLTRANRFGRIRDYAAKVEDETAVLLQIETRTALARTEEIAAVDGVSGIFFGPGDIAADIGKVGHPTDPKVWDIIRAAAAPLIAKGMPVGTLVNDASFGAELLNDGFTFVACGADTVLLTRATDALLSGVKAELKTP